MSRFNFKPDLSNKYDDWYFENLYENLKKRNQLKKFLEIEKKKFKNKSEGVKYDYDLILSKLQKKKYQNKIISVLKKIPPNVIEEWKEEFSSLRNRKKWKDYVHKNQFKDTFVLTPTWIKYIIQFENLNIPITQKLLKQKSGKGGEIHITDAIQSLIKNDLKFIGHNFAGKYLDCGTMNGYIKSSLEMTKI